MAVVTVKLWESEIVYAIGALDSSLHREDKFRVESIAKGLGSCNNVIEVSMAEKLSALTSLREAMTGDWDHLDKGLAETKAKLLKSGQDHPWVSREWVRMEQKLSPA